mmetsp:Transcript_33832/g.60443  ORF Transcript_33832/g.60443 Transcript_33832/m.60443 type:complete len:694 (-) Transcript_33832:339-2420(-)
MAAISMGQSVRVMLLALASAAVFTVATTSSEVHGGVATYVNGHEGGGYVEAEGAGDSCTASSDGTCSARYENNEYQGGASPNVAAESSEPEATLISLGVVDAPPEAEKVVATSGKGEDGSGDGDANVDNDNDATAPALQIAETAKEELRALEQRILSAKNTIEALQVEVAQQEERLSMLMEQMGGADVTQLRRSAVADLRAAGGQQHERTAGGRTIHVKREMWSDHMYMKMAVRVDAEISLAEIVCATPPTKSQDFGTCHYVIIGDSLGKLYFFDTVTGELGAEYATEGGSPITAVNHWPARRNMTMLATGHANGQVLLHRVHESIPKLGGARARNAPEARRTAKYVEPMPTVLGEEAVRERSEPSSDPPRAGVAHLGSFRCGKWRCLAVADNGGGVGVYYENGTARVYDGQTMAKQRPLAMRTASTVVTVVYPNGVATLPTRGEDARLQLAPCKMLNDSAMIAFAWDAVSVTRGYAVTEDGDTLVAIVQGASSNSVQPSAASEGGQSKGATCHVRSRSSSGLPPGALALAHIKGYLLALSQMSIGVFNTTSVYKGAIREVLVEPMESLAAELNHPFDPAATPVVVANRDRLVVVGFSGGVAAFYRSELFVAQPFDMSAMKAWTQPLFVAAMILVGGYQFYKARNKPAKIGSSSSELLSRLPEELRGEINAQMSAHGMSTRRGGAAGAYGPRY